MQLRDVEAASLGRGHLARRLGGQTGILLLGGVFTMLAGLPLQIYVAKSLGASGLGVIGLLEAAVAVLAGLLSLGIAPAVMRFVPEHLERRQYDSVRGLLKSGGAIVAVAGVIGAAAWLVLIPLAARLWPELALAQVATGLMAIMIPLSLVLLFLQQALRGFEEIRYMVIGTSVVQLTVKAVAVLLLFSIGLRLEGYVLAVILSSACAAVWMLLGVRRKVESLPDVGDTTRGRHHDRWMSYAGVMYGNSLLGLGTSQIDRFLVGALTGVDAVGVLSVIRQLQQLPAVLLQMVLTVVAPMFSASNARDDRVAVEHLFHLATDWVFRAALPLLLFLCLFIGPMLRLYGDQFAEEGTVPLLILIAAQAVNLTCGPVGNLLNMSGLERPLLRLSIYQTGATVLGFIVMIPALGLLGAALSIAAGTVLINLGALVLARRRLGIVWWDDRFRGWVLPIVICTVVGLGFRELTTGSGNGWVLAGVLLAMYATHAVVSLLQGLHEDDRELLRHIQRKLGTRPAQ